jgi:hypothetical protein
LWRLVEVGNPGLPIATWRVERFYLMGVVVPLPTLTPKTSILPMSHDYVSSTATMYSQGSTTVKNSRQSVLKRPWRLIFPLSEALSPLIPLCHCCPKRLSRVGNGPSGRIRLPVVTGLPQPARAVHVAGVCTSKHPPFSPFKWLITVPSANRS